MQYGCCTDTLRYTTGSEGSGGVDGLGPLGFKVQGLGCRV